MNQGNLAWKNKLSCEMILTLFTFMFIMLMGPTEGQLTSSVSAELVVDVHRHYQQSCIFLLYSAGPSGLGLQDYLKLLEMQRHLGMSLNLPIVTMDVNTFRYLDRKQGHKEDRPLYALVSSSEEAKRAVKELPRTMDVLNPKWLIFLDSEPIGEFFQDFDIPFNKEILVAQPRDGPLEYELTEVYQLAQGGPMVMFHYGWWRDKQPSSWPKVEMYARRSDMRGIVLRAAVINNPPITYVKQINNKTELTGGFFGIVWKIIEKHLNFTTEYSSPEYPSPKCILCGPTENDTFHGMLGMVIRGEVDLAVDNFQMTSKRHFAVEFSFPLMFTRIRVLIKDSGDTEQRGSAYTRPFRPELWVTVAFSALFIGLYLATLYHYGYHCNNVESGGPFYYTTYQAIFSTFGAFCAQGQHVTPRSLSCRTVFLISYLTSYVILQAYSGSLVSFLTFRQPKLPFKDLAGLLADGSYKLGVIANSASVSMFTDTESTLMRELYSKMVSPDLNKLPETIQEGLERICGPEKYAFMTEYDVATALLGKVACRPVVLPYTSFSSSTSFVLAKHSPYKEVINYLLHKLRNGGIIQRLRLQEWNIKTDVIEHQELKVTLADILPILSMLFLSILLSIIIFIFELYGFNRTKCTNKKLTVSK